MKHALAGWSGGDAWLAESAPARLDQAEFARGMLLLSGAYGRAFDEAATAAYWLALSDQHTADFIAGLKAVLKHERFVTPAAVRAACDEARTVRLTHERAREAAQQRRDDDEAAKAAESRRAEFAREVDSWGDTRPQTAAELLERMRVLALVQGRPSLYHVLGQAQPHGSVDELELRGAALAVLLFEPSRVERLAAEAARRRVRVVLPDRARA